MDASGVAFQRRNRVLPNSSNRLNSRLKNDRTDSEDTLLVAPTSFTSSSTIKGRSQARVHDLALPTTDDVDIGHIRLLGVAQVVSYFVALFIGAFVCFVRHKDITSRTIPFSLHLLFALIDKLGFGWLVNYAFHLWDTMSTESKVRCVKTLTYGSICMNLYPVFCNVSKQSSLTAQGSETASQQNENTSCTNHEDSKQLEPCIDPISDIEYNPVAENGAFMVRVVTAFIFFALVGYDVLLNIALRAMPLI